MADEPPLHQEVPRHRRRHNSRSLGVAELYKSVAFRVAGALRTGHVDTYHVAELGEETSELPLLKSTRKVANINDATSLP
eukprot:CAMPEP_0118659554 /NCGR_PEP_ID=MMETSP0785-20121206/15176_1 /TAXON_ID=91992 /ORGANISM="Bolidomonas pacifica, Strain CCMP 1866" /LENGTH=79 /DNA_ID=CAMNT_0006552671 /DNA_START=178 /DNA_END=413 /DNA_ORIENTATION=+